MINIVCNRCFLSKNLDITYLTSTLYNISFWANTENMPGNSWLQNCTTKCSLKPNMPFNSGTLMDSPQ